VVFNPAHMDYTITTDAYKSKVERKYEEFQILRERLGKTLPYLVIPFLKKKEEKFSQKSIRNRHIFLSVYLN
jgi:hypothetical protein